MTPNDLAAEIYLAAVRERIKRTGLEKIKPSRLEGVALKACELSDVFWRALGVYAREKGPVAMPEPAPKGSVLPGPGSTPSPAA